MSPLAVAVTALCNSATTTDNRTTALLDEGDTLQKTALSMRGRGRWKRRPSVAGEVAVRPPETQWLLEKAQNVEKSETLCVFQKALVIYHRFAPPCFCGSVCSSEGPANIVIIRICHDWQRMRRNLKQLFTENAEERTRAVHNKVSQINHQAGRQDCFRIEAN